MQLIKIEAGWYRTTDGRYAVTRSVLNSWRVWDNQESRLLATGRTMRGVIWKAFGIKNLKEC